MGPWQAQHVDHTVPSVVNSLDTGPTGVCFGQECVALEAVVVDPEVHEFLCALWQNVPEPPYVWSPYQWQVALVNLSMLFLASSCFCP